MALYRLLRSNKESGPYSLNDLLALGLKPYDLVWVDGRSAAWRYPSEVAELKEFAPAVEEQPYDRFYKKSSDTEVAKETPVARQQEIPQQRNEIKQPVFSQPEIPQQKTPVKEPVVFSEPEIIQPQIPLKQNIVQEEPVRKPAAEIPNHSYQQYQPQTQPRKQVFVSMPETNGFNPYPQEVKKNYSEEAYQQYLPKAKPAAQKEPPVEKPYSVPKEKLYSQEKSYSQEKAYAQQQSYSPIDIHEPDDAKLETKYTQSLDDIKEMYINTLVQRKTRNRRKEIFKKYVRPALVPLFLVISGIAIGYVITYKRGASNALQAVSKVVPPPTTPEQNDEAITDNTVPDDKITDKKVVQPEANKYAIANNRKSRNTVPEQRQASVMYQQQNKNPQPVPKAVVPEQKQKEASVPDDEVVSYQKKDVQVDPTTGERTRSVRDNDEIATRENTPKNNNSERYNKKNDREPNFIQEDDDRKSIRDFVSIKNNDYVRGAFGGIRGMELTVYNRSAFLVDEVSIEVQIMKPSEQPLRTDVITVRNISANGAVTIRVPDSQRGIRVDYRITNVESRQWQKSTAGL